MSIYYGKAILDRWSIEQNFHDLKEVEKIEQVQVRRVWSNVGALNLNLWRTAWWSCGGGDDRRTS